MTVAMRRIVSEAFELPPAVRASIVEKLIESLDTASTGELSAQWREEVQRGCAQIDQGAAELRDVEAVFAGAYSALA